MIQHSWFKMSTSFWHYSFFSAARVVTLVSIPSFVSRGSWSFQWTVYEPSQVACIDQSQYTWMENNRGFASGCHRLLKNLSCNFAIPQRVMRVIHSSCNWKVLDYMSVMSVKRPDKDKRRPTVNAEVLFVHHSVSELLQAREQKKFCSLPYDNQEVNRRFLAKTKCHLIHRFVVYLTDWQ